VDVLPEYGPVTVEVQTEALGLSSAEVEQLITVPIEQDLLNGIAFLKDIRSQSVPGLSRIFLVFDQGTDLFTARQVVPFLLHQVIRLRNREMFFLLVVLLCLGTAWITYSLGLSLALGAFLAGLIISESEYSHHIVVEIMPFRDYFASIFFISVGMLLHTDFFRAHWPMLLLVALILVLVKTGVVVATAAILRYPKRSSLLAGLGAGPPEYLVAFGDDDLEWIQRGDGPVGVDTERGAGDQKGAVGIDPCHAVRADHGHRIVGDDRIPCGPQGLQVRHDVQRGKAGQVSFQLLQWNANEGQP